MMEKMYKPQGYNSLSPYLIVDGAQRFIDLMKAVFGAQELRSFRRESGEIAHAELKLDDTIIMVSDSLPAYPATKTMLHFYVPDVFETFSVAIEQGCEIIEPPQNKEGDPDIRGGFRDFAGNSWYVSTQVSEEV